MALTGEFLVLEEERGERKKKKKKEREGERSRKRQKRKKEMGETRLRSSAFVMIISSVILCVRT